MSRESKVGLAMSCKQCHFDRQRFKRGICHPFPGHGGLDKPIVLVLTKVAVCMHCRRAELTVPQKELQVLEQCSP